MNKPLSVYYSGASAGCFFTLTLALASQKTHSISSTQTIQEIIKQNWAIDNVEDWDNYQVPYDYSYPPKAIIPDNNLTKLINNKLPIVKYDQATRLIKDNSVSSLIYTDVDTHFALMEMKRRAFFYGKNKCSFEFNIDNYINVKDPLWPDCKTFNDFAKLPLIIKHELINVFNFPKHFDNEELLMLQFKIDNSFQYKNMRIVKRYNEIIFNKVHHKFLLQDVIKTKFKCVTDTLGLDWTQEVKDHVDLWVSLHPTNIQKMFYKDI